MRSDSRKSAFLILVVIAVMAGCAGGVKVQTSAPMSNGGSMIAISASNFKFSPNEVRVEKPGLLAIEIKNVSGTKHNFTLKDLRGKILKATDLQPGGSVIVNVELPEPGVYNFFCNKTFHSTLGMNGKIIVGQ